jgi:hypothetical protein
LPVDDVLECGGLVGIDSVLLVKSSEAIEMDGMDGKVFELVNVFLPEAADGCD